MRIVLDEMPEDPDPIAPSSQGTIVDADPLQILVYWDESVHRSLHLIPGVDRYHVIDLDSPSELEKSFLNLGLIQDRLSTGESSRCPRRGQLFDCRRGAVSRRVKVCNIMCCDRCCQQEAIEDFITNGAAYGVNVDVTVPEGRNHTGYEYESEDAGEPGKEKLKIEVLPLSDWYITKIWTGRFEDRDVLEEVAG